MSAQITPGPWEVVGNSIVADDICIAVIEDDGGYEAPWEQQIGNGLAIAAIPPILEYLRLRAAQGDETAALLLLKAGQ